MQDCCENLQYNNLLMLILFISCIQLITIPAALTFLCFLLIRSVLGMYYPFRCLFVILLCTHSVLTAIFPGEPGLAGCPLNSPSPFIPGLCILLGQT